MDLFGTKAKRQLAAIQEVVAQSAHGIHKRIDENRELLETLQKDFPREKRWPSNLKTRQRPTCSIARCRKALVTRCSSARPTPAKRCGPFPSLYLEFARSVRVASFSRAMVVPATPPLASCVARAITVRARARARGGVANDARRLQYARPAVRAFCSREHVAGDRAHGIGLSALCDRRRWRPSCPPAAQSRRSGRDCEGTGCCGLELQRGLKSGEPRQPWPLRADR